MLIHPIPLAQSIISAIGLTCLRKAAAAVSATYVPLGFPTFGGYAIPSITPAQCRLSVQVSAP